MPTKRQLSAAGHQEVQGETIAKFELFDAGWNPYSRYLDSEQVDLILRRRTAAGIQYREIQVKYGRLYPRTSNRSVFDVNSWRKMDLKEFRNHASRKDFFVT